MAARLITPSGQQLLVRSKHLLPLLQRLQAFSSEKGVDCLKSSPAAAAAVAAQAEVHEGGDQGEVLRQPWLNIKTGLFGPSDYRFKLPGDIGLGQELSRKVGSESSTEEDKVLQELIYELLKNEETGGANAKLKYSMCRDEVDRDVLGGAAQDLVECPSFQNVEFKSVDCPKLVRKDFQDLFPGKVFEKQNLTAISVSLKTENDMSMWSHATEEEREKLAGEFVSMANIVCSMLQEQGFWADFIDPFSGSPHKGEFTSATMFETDERYRHLGFTVEDLGCCKVISHGKWGSHVFVGSIFTVAPANSDVMKFINGLWKN